MSEATDVVLALAFALERTEANLRAAVNDRPIRDMDENLAEIDAAFEGAQKFLRLSRAELSTHAPEESVDSDEDLSYSPE